MTNFDQPPGLDRMRIVVVSDTHNQHEELGHLSGDVLIHCGDMFDIFNPRKSGIAAIDDWFGRQAFDLILCTGGNHDLELEARLHKDPQPFRNAVYLQDKQYVYSGVKFWGAPWTPDLRSHAFFKGSREMERKWSSVPLDTDVLITHTPPRKILDVSSQGRELGCVALHEVVSRIRPALHCFGHVHNSRGEVEINGTYFVNGSSVGRDVQGTHPALIVEL